MKSIGFGSYDNYRSLGEFHATRGTITYNPTNILKRARKEKEQAEKEEAKKERIKSAIGWVTAPFKKITEETVNTALNIHNIERKVSDEQRIRAIIEEVLIKHGLINPSPNWTRIF